MIVMRLLLINTSCDGKFLETKIYKKKTKTKKYLWKTKTYLTFNINIK